VQENDKHCGNSTGPMQILLIEDDTADQMLFNTIAKQAMPDAVITCAADGKEAISILENSETDPDIIFLDINMPRMNGHEFLEAYGEKIEQMNIPVHVLTSSQYEKDSVLFSPYKYVRGYHIKATDYSNIVTELLSLHMPSENE
jgi:CheY-like chemotaxis protein